MTYDFPKQSVAQSKSFLRYIALRKIYPTHHIRCTREGLPGRETPGISMGTEMYEGQK